MKKNLSYQTENHFKKIIKKRISTKYLLYLPTKYHASKTELWPCIMFLHGGGEQGDNLTLVKKHGIPKIIDKKKDFPFIVISPQCPNGQWWSNDVLINLLKDVIKNYRIDKYRIYLTGISMGGYATWELAIEYPKMFAAIAPICGGGDTYNIKKIKNIPVWVFHGEKDKIVKPYKSKQMVNALKNVGGNARITIYPDMRHDVWTITYKDQKLYKWFLKHKKNIKE
jgi:predicted peptidase